jgi:hypothetical protein
VPFGTDGWGDERGSSSTGSCVAPGAETDRQPTSGPDLVGFGEPIGDVLPGQLGRDVGHGVLLSGWVRVPAQVPAAG